MFAVGTLSWEEVTILMTFGIIGLTIFLVVFSVLNKRPSAPSPASPPPAAPQRHFPAPALPHLHVAVLLIAVLPILIGLEWTVFGQAGMPLVRLTTIVLLLVCLCAVILGGIALWNQRATINKPDVTGKAHGYDSPMHVNLVARITQRFCPRCRAPLAADAPEGLCPACLMAGGLTSATASDPEFGMAATTPPSGSLPTTVGEWTELATHFPQLEILELLGRGGMGAVYKARQKHLDRVVALKVIPPEAAKDPAFAERFAREARALARLNHPGIVTVYDFGQAGDVYFLLMEYVDGVNLRHAQQASRLQPAEALAIVPQICDALQYAHDQGVVHRDIKPENILLDRLGRVKIADFGLAKLLGKGPDDFTLTHTKQVMGTPRYMAPEQIEKPTTVDHRADIYSLGVVLYEMLTGELPLGRFEPPSRKVQIDVRIDDVVLRALEKEPARRFQRASQVKSELASASGWNAPAPRNEAVAGRPEWQTPAPPPSKSDGTNPPVLTTMLQVACGMQIGLLLIAASLATFIYGVTAHPSFGDKFWGWFAASFGLLCGGLGCLKGCYTKYRQLAGAADLARSPSITWFDWLQGGQLMLGAAFLGWAAVLFSVYNTLTDACFAFLAMGIASSCPAAIILVRRAWVIAQARVPQWAVTHTQTAPKGESILLVLAVAFGIVLGFLVIAAVLIVGIYMLRIDSLS